MLNNYCNLPQRVRKFRKGSFKSIDENYMDKFKETYKYNSPLRAHRSSVSWTALPANLEEKIFDVTGLLQRKANALRAQPPVNWEPYVRADLMSRESYTFITAYQATKTKEERDQLLDQYDHTALRNLIGGVQKVCAVEEIQKFLILIDDMLWEEIDRVYLFRPYETEPWKVFLELLSTTDDFVRNISSRIVAKLISVPECPIASADLEYYFNWLKMELRGESQWLQSIARCLQRVLRLARYRNVFFHMNGIFRIIRLLGKGVNQQDQYQLIFCLWVSSYSPQIAERLNRFSTIPVIMEILTRCPSENVKLPRVILATLRNLLEKPPEPGERKHNAYIMLQCKVLKFIESTKKKHSSMALDPEYTEDLEVVEEALMRHIDELSTFDAYALEVKSGRLEWSVVHKSKKFWEENIDRFHDNKYELLKILISVLEESQDTIVLCVAAHDLGNYMSQYPRGKKVIENLGGKDILLKLLSHEQPEVKYHVLKALQILMLNSYELLVDYINQDRTTLQAIDKFNTRYKFKL